MEPFDRIRGTEGSPQTPPAGKPTSRNAKRF